MKHKHIWTAGWLFAVSSVLYTKVCTLLHTNHKNKKKALSAYVLVWKPYNVSVIKKNQEVVDLAHLNIYSIIALLFGLNSPTELELKSLLSGASAEETPSLWTSHCSHPKHKTRCCFSSPYKSFLVFSTTYVNDVIIKELSFKWISDIILVILNSQFVDYAWFELFMPLNNGINIMLIQTKLSKVYINYFQKVERV